jgi:hypothetical protein
MGKRIENNCVSCEYCVNCGRRHETVYYCDKCDEYADMWNVLYKVDGQELCIDCVKDMLVSKVCDDMDEEKCGRCNNEAETLYQYDGEWLCEDCLKSVLERVDMEE